MEVDGLSLKEAQELAAVSVTPRSSTDWVALVQELDGLIDRYCQACKLSKDTQIHIREVRRRQSLVSIPLAVKWFRRELAAIEGKPAP
jgi:hypothetical protein